MYLCANAEIASAHHLLDFQARWKVCFPHSFTLTVSVSGAFAVAICGRHGLVE